MTDASGMQVCVLASGSKGNSIYVSSGETRLLIDAGLPARQLAARLGQIGVSPESICALMVTHDHVDHYRGVEVFSRKYAVPLFANENTAMGIDANCPKLTAQWAIFETAASFTIGDLQVESFSVSHDAADPVGFILDNGRSRLGIVTDLGYVSTVVKHKLSSCNAVIIESNHDYDMLMDSQRPWSLKQRISGRSGHLSNDDAAHLLTHILSDKLHTVLLAHISEDCNTPERALSAARRILQSNGRTDIHLDVLQQTTVSPFYRV